MNTILQPRPMTSKPAGPGRRRDSRVVLWAAGLAVVFGSALTALAQTPTAPPAEKASSPAPAPAASQPKDKEGQQPPVVAPNAPPTTADDLLAALENADKGLKTFTAAIQYVKFFPDDQGGGSHTRRGTIWFSNEDAGAAVAKPRRRFAVRFDSLMIDGKYREEKRSFTFDGMFLVERDEANKQYFRRRMVAEGSDADPMRIGEGPLPLPIGQRKADIAGRFDVTLEPALDGAPDGDGYKKLRQDHLAGAWQLKLIPKPGTPQARDFREIRLWYRTEDLLPVFAMASNPDNSRSEVFLLNGNRKVEIPASTFETAPPPASEGWAVQDSEFREKK